MFSITQMAHIIALRATLRFRPLSGIVFSIAAHYEKFGFGGNCFRPLSGIMFSILCGSVQYDKQRRVSVPSRGLCFQFANACGGTPIVHK